MTMHQSAISRRAALGWSAAAAMSAFGMNARAASPTDIGFQLSWIKSIQYGGYFAGLEIQSFARHGVHATFNAGGPNIDPVANVTAGRLQLGDRPSGPLIIAREKGMPIKVIANVFQRSPLSIISLASKPIRTVKELKGKTMAVATSNKPLILNLLKDAGLSADDVNLVPSAPDPSALVSGQIDAYSGYSTNQGVMLETRGVKIFSLGADELGIPETAGVIYGREDYLESHRQDVVNFLRGAVEGWKWALGHKEEIAHLMVNKYGAPGLDYNAQFNEIKASEPYINAGVGAKQGLLAIDLPLYDRIINLYRKVGMVRTGIKAADLCDPSFIDAALKA